MKLTCQRGRTVRTGSVSLSCRPSGEKRWAWQSSKHRTACDACQKQHVLSGKPQSWHVLCCSRQPRARSSCQQRLLVFFLIACTKGVHLQYRGIFTTALVGKPAEVSSEGSWSSTVPVEGQLKYVLKSAGAREGWSKFGRRLELDCVHPRPAGVRSECTVNFCLGTLQSVRHRTSFDRLGTQSVQW